MKRPPWTSRSTASGPSVLCEAVGDRSPNAYEANLYDVDGKYGDVVSLEEVLKYLEEKGAAHTR